DGLLVYDTDTASFWFYDSSAWQNLSSGGGAHPWYLQGSTPPAPATSNSSNVYVMGSVAVGKTQATSGVMLDVQGSVRGGVIASPGTIGPRSTAIGDGVIASGNNAAAFGNQSKSIGNNSITSGYGSEAAANQSVALGNNNKANGERSVVFGTQNVANGLNAVTFGERNVISRNNASVFGTYNIDHADFLFVIGNGTSATRKNEVTIRSNGWMGIGATTPTGSEKLKVNGSIVT